jgi:hypothetical protein
MSHRRNKSAVSNVNQREGIAAHQLRPARGPGIMTTLLASLSLSPKALGARSSYLHVQATKNTDDRPTKSCDAAGWPVPSHVAERLSPTTSSMPIGVPNLHEALSDHACLICEVEPLHPDLRRFNNKGLFGSILKAPTASSVPGIRRSIG